MLMSGLPLLPVLLVTALGILVLVALHWLKTRYPGHPVASTMLWREALQASRPRALWQRLARPLSLLAPLFAMLALAAAVLEPIWPLSTPQTGTVLLYEPQCRQQALKVFNNLNPLQRHMVLVRGQGVVTDDQRIHPQQDLSALPPISTDYQAVAALAERLAGPQGTLVWFGQTPPPQLPANCAFITVTSSETLPSAPALPLKLHLVKAPAAVADTIATMPGLVLVATPEDADMTYVFPAHADSALDAAEGFFQALNASGLYREEQATQQQEVPARTDLPQLPRSLSLSGLLFLLALLSYLADLWLWSRRRTV